MDEKPEMSKISLMVGCMAKSRNFPPVDIIFFCTVRNTRNPVQFIDSIPDDQLFVVISSHDN